MKTIILAAGYGKRLGKMTESIPKACITVSSRPLIQYAIAFAKQLNSSQIIVVGGYQCSHLWETIKNESVVRLENPDFQKGNLHSLNTARSFMAEDFVQMNVDHLYPSYVAHRIKTLPNGIWAVSDFDRPLFSDDMKIAISGNLDQGAHLTHISKNLMTFDGGYCGITVVTGSERKDYLAAFQHVLDSGKEQAVVEDVLDELIRLSQPPKVCDISTARWLEIDTPQDYDNAARILRMKPDYLN